MATEEEDQILHHPVEEDQNLHHPIRGIDLGPLPQTQLATDRLLRPTQLSNVRRSTSSAWSMIAATSTALAFDKQVALEVADDVNKERFMSLRCSDVRAPPLTVLHAPDLIAREALPLAVLIHTRVLAPPGACACLCIPCFHPLQCLCLDRAILHRPARVLNLSAALVLAMSASSLRGSAKIAKRLPCKTRCLRLYMSAMLYCTSSSSTLPVLL